MPTIERLCVHMAEMHNMPTDVQETEFTNEDEFQVRRRGKEGKGKERIIGIPRRIREQGRKLQNEQRK